MSNEREGNTPIEEGKIYTFKELEDYLNKWDNRANALIVVYRKQNAMMHVFGGNFCGDWRSGDGVLFYDDTEVHSAEPSDPFMLKQIIKF